MPLISVLMPVYNGWPYVWQAVESILGQTLTDWEFVVVDDASTDLTLDYLMGISDPRFRLTILPENQGVAAALNIGYGLCTGSIIARQDADDASFPHRLERQLAFLSSHPDLDGCGSFLQPIGPDGQFRYKIWTYPTTIAKTRHDLPFSCTIPHPTYFFHRRVYDEFAPHPYNLDFLWAEDYEFLFRALQKFHLTCLGEPLVYHRVHPGQRTQRNATAQQKYVDQARKIWAGRFT